MLRSSLSEPRYLSRFRLPLALVVVTVAYGTVGYRLLEGWSWLDCAYMTTITLTTVGYKEVQPLDAGGQAFTISLLFLGVVTLLSAISIGTELLASGDLAAGVRRRRMRKRLDALHDHFVICGFGRVGRAAADDFAREGVPFAVIDPADQLDVKDINHVVGDATDESALRAAGIERARALLCAVDSDAVNVYLTLTARALNPGLVVVARSSSTESVQILERAGADRVVSPYSLSGRRMAFLSLRPSVVDFIDSVTIAPGLRLEEIIVAPNSWLAGKALREVGGAQPGVRVLAVKRAESGELVASPSAELVLLAGDLAVVLGPADALEAFV